MDAYPPEYDYDHGDPDRCQECGGRLLDGDNPPTDSPGFHGCCSWACVDDYYSAQAPSKNDTHRQKMLQQAAKGIKALESGCDDIWDTEAYQCGDGDSCEQPGGWHKRTYWCTPTREGFTVDEYSSGDHEPITAGWVPSSEKTSESWKRYRAWVAENGVDPLGDFLVRTERKVRERWFFRFSRSILGVVLYEAKRAGRHYWPNQLPKHVREYLNLETPTRRGVLQDFASVHKLDEFEKTSGCRYGVWCKHYIEHRVPRDVEVVRRELVRAARKSA